MRILGISGGIAGLALAGLCALPAPAQQAYAPAGYAPLSAPCSTQPDGTCAGVSPTTPLPVQAKQELVQLAAGNTAAAAQTVYGGTYWLNQICTGYGSVALRYRGPDGATMLTLIAKTAADTAGGTQVQFGSGTTVDIVLNGTTGCSVQLSRVP